MSIELSYYSLKKSSPLLRYNVSRRTDWAGSWLARIASNTGGIQMGPGVFLGREFDLAQT